MSCWRIPCVGLLAATLVWSGCGQGRASEGELHAEGELVPPVVGPPDPAAPRVWIDAMDNARQLLEGRVWSDGGVQRISVYENGRWLANTTAGGDGHWSVPWHPSEASRSLEVRARDVLGRVGSTELELRPVRFGEEVARLDATATLLRLPHVPFGMGMHYTLDGSTPTPASPAVTGPLVLLGRHVSAAPLSLIPTNPPESPIEWRWTPPAETGPLARVVRLQMFLGGEPQGPSQIQTYLPGTSSPALPVLSLVTDAGHFFDPLLGIYVPGRVHEEEPDWTDHWGTGNYMRDGKEWERPVHVEWFEASGRRALAQHAGVRIHGGGSAALPQKSLRLYAKDDYGPATFAASVFPQSPLREFKRLIVRSSGQDSLASKLKDCALQGLLLETTLDVQACVPTVMFLNGEYWGLHELRERYDEYYLAGHHDLDRKKVVILQGDGALDVGSPGDEAPYAELLAFVRGHDLALAEHSAHVAARMDVDNFIDYTIAEIYLGNHDWPHNNVKLWRYPAPAGADTPSMKDGRWRWLLYDLDYAFSGSPDVNSLRRMLEDETLDGTLALLLRELLKAPGFKARFVARFLWHLENTFTPERVLARIEDVAGELAPEMPAHVARWGHPASVEEWGAQVQVLRDWAVLRPGYMRQFLEEAFGPP
ncbi:MAG: CotH kinase family protein [Cystobacter sp.]